MIGRMRRVLSHKRKGEETPGNYGLGRSEEQVACAPALW